MTGAGLKKCMPTTRSGPGTPAAISVTLSDEVLVASTQSSRTTSATLPNSSRLSSSDSGAASITMSASASAPTSAAASSGPARALLEPALLDLALEPLAHAGEPALERVARRGRARACARRARAASCAMPAPIVPAPRTPTITAADRAR